jgi:hypothetical protein
LSSAARPAGFLDEENASRANCSVPAKLFYQATSAGDADDMVSLTGERYLDLPNAFRYRSKYIERCACKPRPWSAEAKAEYERRAVLATRNRASRMAAGGAAEMAKLLAEADIEVAQRAPEVRAVAYRRSKIEQYPVGRGLFWRFRGVGTSVGSRSPRPQTANSQRRLFLLRSR